MNRIFWIIFVGFTLVSCNIVIQKKDIFPKDLRISNTQGIPNDSLVYYFPETIIKDTQILKTEINSCYNNWYSCNLHIAKEPILYNFYLGYDIYRFLWLRSFHRPVVISLINKDDKIRLIIKQLDRQPKFVNIYMDKEYLSERDSIVVKADRFANIILNKTIRLSIKEWQRFELLLNDCSFWNSQPYQKIDALDGSQWIIEGHLKNKYWFVDRWSPEDSFRKAGEYLIHLSGLKEKIY